MKMLNLTISEYTFIKEAIEETLVHIKYEGNMEDVEEVLESSLEILSNPKYYEEELVVEPDEA